MTNNDISKTGAPTRRDYMKNGGAVIGGTLLAGCAGQPDSTLTPTETSAGDDSTETGTGDQRYSVTMEPMGTVEFEEPPDEWMTNSGFFADNGVALGQADGLTAMPYPTWTTVFYDELPGISVNKAGLTTLGEGGKLDKEFFYEVNPDLILSDPNRFIYQNVEVKDIDEIIENVAPFVGCRGRRYWSEESRYKWPDGEPYRYYSLREHLEMYGQAFQEQERAEAMSELHRATIEDITSRVPRSGDRPEIGLIWHDPSTQEFWVYNLESKNKKTWGKKHYRDLNVKDAFAGIFDGESSVVVDYEVVLEHDPDKLFFNFGISANEEMAEKAFEEMPEDSVGSQLTAVQNDQLYKGGTAYQGPIINLFQTEMLAKQLYPEEFGEWQGIGETPEEEQLFDRQRIADIINGDI